MSVVQQLILKRKYVKLAPLYIILIWGLTTQQMNTNVILFTEKNFD